MSIAYGIIISAGTQRGEVAFSGSTLGMAKRSSNLLGSRNCNELLEEESPDRSITTLRFIVSEVRIAIEC